MPRKTTAARIAYAAALLVLALTLVPAALAGKGSAGGTTGGGGHKGGGGTTGGGGGSLSLVMVTDNNGDGLPNWGDTVTFNVSTTATAQPHVDLTCTQNGVLVYSATSGFYPGYPWPWTQDMTLSSQMWSGGAASCTSRLYYISGSSTVTLSTLSFPAGA
jgi:hypothetical protein